MRFTGYSNILKQFRSLGQLGFFKEINTSIQKGHIKLSLTVKTFKMLTNIFISNKWCLNFLLIKKSWKKNIFQKN